jgi:hypothetical protein
MNNLKSRHELFTYFGTLNLDSLITLQYPGYEYSLEAPIIKKALKNFLQYLQCKSNTKEFSYFYIYQLMNCKVYIHILTGPLDYEIINDLNEFWHTLAPKTGTDEYFSYTTLTDNSTEKFINYLLAFLESKQIPLEIRDILGRRRRIMGSSKNVQPLVTYIRKHPKIQPPLFRETLKKK